MRWPAVLFLSVPGRCGCHHPGNKVCVKTEEPAHFLPDPISHHSLGPGLVHAYSSNTVLVLSLKKLVVLPTTLRRGALRIAPPPPFHPTPFLLLCQGPSKGKAANMQPPDLADEILGYSAGGKTERSKGRPYVRPQGIGSWSWGGRLKRGRAREAPFRVAIKT